MFNTRNKSGISAHPCIILYICYILYLVRALHRNRRAAGSIPAIGHIVVFFAAACDYV